MIKAGTFVVALMSTWTTIVGDDPSLNANLVDLFGGGDALVFETAVRSGTTDNTTAWFRNDGGCQDTNNNLNDFTASPVAGQARNTASAVHLCSPTADLTVTVTDAPDPVLTGNAVTYTVNVPNSGTANATSAVINIGLTGSSYPGSIGGLSNTTDCTFATPNITCNVATINAGSNFTFTFQVTPAAAGTITANATVSAAAPEINSNNTGSATTTVNDPVVLTADLSVSIADTPDPVVTGNPVSYTVTVNNAGNDAAVNSQLTVTLGGAAYPGAIAGLTGTGCAFTSPTITCGLGSIAAAGNSIVTFNITPAVAGDITLDATVSADAPETGGNNTDSETTTVTDPIPAVGNFELVAPDEGQILRTTTTNFQWTESASAATYDIFVSNLSTNTRLGETYTVSKNAVDICTAGVCSVASTELVANLEQGTYSWTVIAANGSTETEASNGPNLFTVDLDGMELVSNGGLEDGIVDWTFTAGANRKCKAGWGNASDCAIKLRPGSKAHQRGVMGPILAATDTDSGDVLLVSAAVRTNKAAKQRVLMVVVNYVDTTAGATGNGKDKFRLFVEQTTVGYETFSASFTLDGEIRNGRVVVSNTLPAGTLRVDDVSVVLMPIGTAPRAAAPAPADGVLPVPAAPANFRGNN